MVTHLSTTSPASKVASGNRVQAAGGLFLDAPFFGTLAEAEAGGLWPVVGGSDEAFTAGLQYLETFSDDISRVGAVGAGATMKLAGNLLVFAMVNSLAEALALLGASGSNTETFLHVLAKTGFRSPINQTKGRLMIDDDFAPRGSVATAIKDLDLIVGAAEAAGVAAPMAHTARKAFPAARDDGLADHDMASVIRVRRKGVPVDRSRRDRDLSTVQARSDGPETKRRSTP